MNFYVPFTEVDRRHERLYQAIQGGIEVVDEHASLLIFRSGRQPTAKLAVWFVLHHADDYVIRQEALLAEPARSVRLLEGREQIIVRQRDEWEGIEGAADVVEYEALCEIGVAF